MRPAFMMTHSDLVLSQKHVTCNCAFRHNYHQTLSSFPLHSSRSHNEPSTTLEKRIKQYFFKLLFAARNRDERLLKVVLRSLADDEDFQRERPRLYSKNLRELNDVLLKASSRCGQIALADRVFKVMLVNGEPPTQRTAGAFLSALKLSGRSDHCVYVFKEMVEMGVDVGNVCFNVVISALVQAGDFDGAMSMLQSAAEWNISPDIYTFNILFDGGAKHNTTESIRALEEAQDIMVQRGVAPDRVTINAKINHAIIRGNLEEARRIFERVLDGGFEGVDPDVITFNTGISAFMALDMREEAFGLLEVMEMRNIRPRVDTFNSIITGLLKARDVGRVMDVFNQYLRLDRGKHAGSVTPSLLTYNLVLSALCLTNDKNQARLVEAEMRRRRINPDIFTLTALVRLQYCRRDVYAVMDVSRTLRIPPSLAFLNSCIKALADHGDLVGACRVMDRMNLMGSTSPDTCSYNSLIYALIQEPWIIEVIEGYTVGLNDPPGGGDFAQVSDTTRNDGTIGKFRGLAGIDAALLLLEGMKAGIYGTQAGPDIFTYTTVIVGIARATDAQASRGQGARLWSQDTDWVDGEDLRGESGGGFMSSSEKCKQLYFEAVKRGISINGKICNAVMLGFGSDLQEAVLFWKQHIRQALAGTVKDSTLNHGEGCKDELLSAYCGLLHVCGRARRPDAAVKVVAALRRDGIKPCPELSNTYFKAKQDHGASDSSVLRRMPFRIMQLLDGQMENLLEVECGISQYSDPLDVPIERIRVRF